MTPKKRIGLIVDRAHGDVEPDTNPSFLYQPKAPCGMLWWRQFTLNIFNRYPAAAE